MWTKGGSTKYKRLCKLLQDTTVIYNATIDSSRSPTVTHTKAYDDDIYDPSSNWDDTSAVHHEGD
jgi:hypothetical protein